jgi:23S rRNA (uracil1939-C5)-methyltransferase
MSDPEILIESLDHEARGIGHVAGKVIFVERALPGERVRYRSLRSKSSYEFAAVREILHPSPARVEPRCPYFGRCGGCSMQHLDSPTQVAVKQRVLEDNLLRIGKVRPEVIYRAIHGPNWRYRFRARLSVRYIARRETILIGFHERKSSWVADMQTCEILPAHVSALLVPLRALIGSLSIRERLPQIELSIGDGRTALVLRILEALNAADLARLETFATTHAVDFWLQPKGPESARPFGRAALHLFYRLPEFGVVIPFLPADFTQVNHAINRVLVCRAIDLLAPKPGDRVCDLFSGLGNFTVPLARRAREVVGVEGSVGLTMRARRNAAENGVADRTSFLTQNLFEIGRAELDALGRFDKMLIDPPREGALAVCKALVDQGTNAPSRIVYVSCNPSTLARDAAILVHQGGYRLLGAGVINMFPQTSHVESIAVFESG